MDQDESASSLLFAQCRRPGAQQPEQKNNKQMRQGQQLQVLSCAFFKDSYRHTIPKSAWLQVSEVFEPNPCAKCAHAKGHTRIKSEIGQ